MFTRFGGTAVHSVRFAPGKMLTYLEAAEDGKEIVKRHDIAVHCHQPQQPRGADEQQEQECCPQHGAVKHTEVCSMRGDMRKAQLPNRGGTTWKFKCPFLPESIHRHGEEHAYNLGSRRALWAVPTSPLFPTPSLCSVTSNIRVIKKVIFFVCFQGFLQTNTAVRQALRFSLVDCEEEMCGVNGQVLLISAC